VLWSSPASVSPRRLLIVAAAALIPVLAGCEAGNDAPTLQFHVPTVGAQTTTQNLAIQNVFVLTGPQETAIAAGQTVGLYFALINTGGSDRLLSITAPGTAASVTLPGGGITVNQSHTVLLTGPQPEATMKLTRRLLAGTVMTINMNFQKAGTVQLRVPVLGGSTYSSFSPAPTPTPTSTATGAAKKRHHHAGASSTASPSPSAS
jgi:copper(I)-binding protein